MHSEGKAVNGAALTKPAIASTDWLSPRIKWDKTRCRAHALAQFPSDFGVAHTDAAEPNEIIDGKLSRPMGAHSFLLLTGLEVQCHCCDATGDVDTLVTFDAERLQRD